MSTTTPTKATASSTPSATPSATYIFPNQPGIPAPTGPLPGTEAIYNLPTGTSPFAYPALPSGAGGPNDPNFNHGQNTAGGDGNNSNIGMIVGITVAGVAALAMVGLFIQRYRAQSRTNTINSHQTRSRTKRHQTSTAGGAHPVNIGEDDTRSDRAKLAKSFTIRKPPSVYVDDDQDLDQTGHPRYKSASDAYNHPYYGDRAPGLVEYELSDTSGQKYGPSSVAERKRYVEQQQRKVMDEYEMFNPHNDAPPTPYPASPYPPSQLTSAPSYTSGPGPLSPTMTPSMGGRSPRVQHHPSQSPSPFGRPMQHDSNDYNY
ncbi:hypothetical protein BG011_008081 [Mortierella polycephala]|uniref:Uncharacterized protein n=1 Tax=Mortierella polycephala TaxID=41804 RepID=A0A9P6QBW9_9FUNG|nr:hypothetical protein BG011_008081 [Mortierella polycephala]